MYIYKNTYMYMFQYKYTYVHVPIHLQAVSKYSLWVRATKLSAIYTKIACMYMYMHAYTSTFVHLQPSPGNPRGCVRRK